MSVLTSTPLKVAPPAGSGVTLVTGAAWTYGAWIEVLSATAAPVALAGVALTGGTYAGRWWELDLGVGAVGAEASIGTLRVYLHNSANYGFTGFLLPVPLGGIGAGARVAVRSRSNVATTDSPATLSLLYYENLSSDHVASSPQALSSAPSGADPLVSITPNATPWANSAWAELIASAATDLGLIGLVHGATSSAGSESGMEYDLGTGAAGAETVITTLREGRAHGKTPHTWLPGIYPITAGTRLAVRLRKAGTDSGGHPVAVLYYTHVSAVVAVPDVVGMTEAEADAALLAATLVTGTVTTASDPVVPAGQVISQSPTAGTLVAPGSAVAIVLSTGPALVTVPDVVGLSEVAATDDLVAASLTTGTVTYASHPTIPVGHVIAQTPTAGSSVAPGTAVDLVLSTGPHDYTWQIKDLTGATRWMTGLVVFPVGDAVPGDVPSTVSPTQVVIPMHVTTRVIFAVGMNEWGADCLCDE